MSKNDIQFMERALFLAQLGRFTVSPNPRVGAVIVHNNSIIGEGYHQHYGQAHAEVNAVESVKNKELLSDATIYVTLEPCAHFGKTPPCAQLLVKWNFKRVVICNQDPFEAVNGSGIAILRNAGIAVEIGCCQERGIELNKRFFTFHQKERPYVVLKWAESKDGFIAPEGKRQEWITGEQSKQLVHLWRSEEDAILVGKNTALIDNPSLTVREVHGKNPVRILIDGKLEVPTNYHIYSNEARTLVLNQKQAKREENIEWIKGNHRENLAQKIMELCYDRGLQSIIIEGGGSILQQFIDADLWDEARVFSGRKEFKRGIKAPQLNNKSGSLMAINTDQLNIVHNR